MSSAADAVGERESGPAVSTRPPDIAIETLRE